MSKTTPADLVIAYRSLTRRRTEAVDAAKDASLGGLLGELDGHIAAAATLVGAASDPGAVADAIASRRARDWDVATIEALRDHATAAGGVLRRIAEAGPPADD